MSKKMDKDVILKHKEYQTLIDFANTLEAIAKKLKEEKSFTISKGQEDTLIQPNDQVEVKYSYKTKGEKHEFEIELEWIETARNNFSIK